MRRQRRTRSIRRRGVQHVGNLLSAIITDLDQEEAAEAHAVDRRESKNVPASVSVDPQFTFAFYQTAEA